MAKGRERTRRRRPLKPSEESIRDLVVFADTHSACYGGLCPPEGFTLDNGDGEHEPGHYTPTYTQRYMHSYFRDCWKTHVPAITCGRPLFVVHDGDIVDGDHHGTVRTITRNSATQQKIAVNLLRPVMEHRQVDGRMWIVRGTEAHAGHEGCSEESIGRALGVRAFGDPPNEIYTRWRLRKKLLGGKYTVDLQHHITPAGSTQARGNAMSAEMTESMVSAATWPEHYQADDVIVRAHGHTCDVRERPWHKGMRYGVTLPAWQAFTPFVRKASRIGRVGVPEIGMVVITAQDDGVKVTPLVAPLFQPEAE